jgi:hypothetical protein
MMSATVLAHGLKGMAAEHIAKSRDKRRVLCEVRHTKREIQHTCLYQPHRPTSGEH